MDLDKLLADARETTRRMDEMERGSDFASISDLIPTNPSAVMRTAIEALKAGVSGDDWTCIAEGIVMLQDLERHVRAMTS
jgi:hypothetical protein